MQLIALATAALSSVAFVAAAEHQVTVGTALVYDPPTTVAAAGDTVVFTFKNAHTVTRSTFDTPCSKDTSSGSFDSDTLKSGTFTVNVTDTEPIWIFCELPGHCQAGMVAAINPPTNGTDTFANFQAKAEGKSVSSAPSGTGGSSSGGATGTPSRSGTSSSPSPSKSGAASARIEALAPPTILLALTGLFFGVAV